ncbi:protein TANC2 [Arapaima gigas]
MWCLKPPRCMSLVVWDVMPVDGREESSAVCSTSQQSRTSPRPPVNLHQSGRLHLKAVDLREMCAHTENLLGAELPLPTAAVYKDCLVQRKTITGLALMACGSSTDSDCTFEGDYAVPPLPVTEGMQHIRIMEGVSRSLPSSPLLTHQTIGMRLQPMKKLTATPVHEDVKFVVHKLQCQTVVLSCVPAAAPVSARNSDKVCPGAWRPGLRGHVVLNRPCEAALDKALIQVTSVGLPRCGDAVHVSLRCSQVKRACVSRPGSVALAFHVNKLCNHGLRLATESVASETCGDFFCFLLKSKPAVLQKPHRACSPLPPSVAPSLPKKKKSVQPGTDQQVISRRRSTATSSPSVLTQRREVPEFAAREELLIWVLTSCMAVAPACGPFPRDLCQAETGRGVRVSGRSCRAAMSSRLLRTFSFFKQLVDFCCSMCVSSMSLMFLKRSSGGACGST